MFKKVFIIFSLLYILFFVKTWGSVTGNIYTHDDVVYYAQTASLVNDFDIDIRNNLGPYANIYLQINQHTGRIMSYQPLGPTLLYIIPYLLTKPVVYFISMIRGAAFDQYDPLFFVILCFFTLVLFNISGSFLCRIMRLFFVKPIAEITAVFVLWGTILPVYVFRRPIFGVIPEFFTVTLLVYYLVRIYKESSISIKNSCILGAITGFLAITRWNDVYLLLPCLILLIVFSLRAYKKDRFQRSLYNSVAFLTVFGIILSLQAAAWVKIYGSVNDFLSYYYQIHASYISSKNTAAMYLRNLLHIFFGLDWGILFTMPVLLLGGIAFTINPKIMIPRHKILSIMLFILTFWACFHVVLQWKNTGEFYGYRFLVSLLPLCAIGFAALIEIPWLKYKKIISFLILVFCLFNFFIILPFELTDKTTLLPDNISPMGGRGWGNNAYFINALKFYFQSDLNTLISDFSRGYLAAFIFGIISLFGIDLARFGDKVKNYFSLTSYRSCIAFFYPVLMAIWFYFLRILDRKFIQNEQN